MGGREEEEGVVVARQQQPDEDLRPVVRRNTGEGGPSAGAASPYAPAPYGWGRQDHQRYTDWGDKDFRCNTNGRTQSVDHTQDHANSEVPPTVHLQD